MSTKLKGNFEIVGSGTLSGSLVFSDAILYNTEEYLILCDASNSLKAQFTKDAFKFNRKN